MINLQKGQKISLSKESQGLKDIMIGLGWDKAKQTKLGGLFSRRKPTNSIDCDASAILLDNDGKCISNKDVIYFGNLKHSSGAVIHMGDNLTGEGVGDDEQILIHLQELNPIYDEIVFVVNIYKATEKCQNFGMIDNAFIRIVDISNGNKEICKFNISSEPTYGNKTSMIFGKVYRHNGEWKFNAIGEGLTLNSISSIVNYFK